MEAHPAYTIQVNRAAVARLRPTNGISMTRTTLEEHKTQQIEMEGELLPTETRNKLRNRPDSSIEDFDEELVYQLTRNNIDQEQIEQAIRDNQDISNNGPGE